MAEFIKAIPLTFIPIFVAMDIFAVLPIFMSVTSAMPSKKKKAVVSQSIATALVVSLLFAAMGKSIFKILGITVDDFKVAGGLLLLVLSILDLTRYERRLKPSGTVGVVPIGVPLIVGPAVLTTLLVLIDLYGAAPTMVSLLLNLFIVWASFLGANRIIKFLGESGIVALSKVMAILLATIAVMMIRLGLENIIPG